MWMRCQIVGALDILIKQPTDRGRLWRWLCETSNPRSQLLYLFRYWITGWMVQQLCSFHSRTPPTHFFCQHNVYHWDACFLRFHFSLPSPTHFFCEHNVYHWDAGYPLSDSPTASNFLERVTQPCNVTQPPFYQAQKCRLIPEVEVICSFSSNTLLSPSHLEMVT